MAFSKTYYTKVSTNKVIPAAALDNSNPGRMLQTQRNLLGGIGSRNASLSVYDALDGTQADETVTWAAVASKGAGASNAAFAFIAGSAGACTVTIGAVTGITITGSGTAATDATALAAAIEANATIGPLFVVTANAGDVRMVSTVEGAYNFTTTVTASGGGKLSAAGAALISGTPTGALGSVVVGGHTEALGDVGASATVGVSAAATAANIDAQLQANADIQLIADTSCVYGTDVVLTVTADVFPPQAELGNAITLTATVGTAGAGVLSGGVNAAANSHTY
jgi:hypothetical protein